MIKAAILSPIDNSLYSLLVTHLLHNEPDIQVVGVAVRSILNFKRFRSEIRRDGAYLWRKIWYKVILDERFSTTNRHLVNPLQTMATQVGLETRSLRKLGKLYGFPVRFVADHNDEENIAFFKSIQPDIVVFTGGGIIRQPLLDRAGQGVLNAHSGILPYYRGVEIIKWPVLEGQHDLIGLGVTLHLMDKGVDTGPIIAQRAETIKQGDDFSTIRGRCLVHMVELLHQGVCMARDGKLVLQPQDPQAGRQYFVMHPRLLAIANQRLADLTNNMA